jgi:hypothetical protein
MLGDFQELLHCPLTRDHASSSADGNKGSAQVPWHRQLESCSGYFNVRQRALEIQTYKSCPTPLVPVSIVVDESKAQEAGISTEDCDENTFFLCFGFSKTEPFVAPGTPVHFFNQQSIQEWHTPLCFPEPDRVSVISAMCVAVGKRTGEYAVIISFDRHVLSRDVSALFDYTFSITEIENGKSVCESIQNIVRHYSRVSGDIDERICGHECMADYGLNKWRGSIARIEHTTKDAQGREKQRDMLSYLKSLACTDGLRSMGVRLKNEEPMPTAPNALSSSSTAAAGNQQQSRPSTTPTSAAAAGNQQQSRPSTAATGTQQQQQQHGETSSTEQHPVFMKSTREDLAIVGVKRKVEFAIENNSIGKLALSADKVMKRRKTFVAKAHGEYMAGLVACMCHSPFGIRQYLGAYEDFMRIAGAAELSLYEPVSQL